MDEHDCVRQKERIIKRKLIYVSFYSQRYKNANSDSGLYTFKLQIYILRVKYANKQARKICKHVGTILNLYICTYMRAHTHKHIHIINRL